MRLFLVIISGAIAASIAAAGPVGFTQHNLASDASDSHLLNAWGLAATGGSPWWIGANGSGLALVYNGNTGAKVGLEVTIPGDGSVTGVTTNPGSSGGSFNGDVFLFASEDGTVSGWRNPPLGTLAEVLQTGSTNNVYKGLTYGATGGGQYLYLANFRSGAIDVLANPGSPGLGGNFTDPNLPAGYAPFNIQNIGGVLYVTYALQDVAKKDEVAGLGNGFVDTFDLNGSLLARVASGGVLNAPWGVAIAPTGFGDLGGDLLVGNFGDGMIHAYSGGVMVETVSDNGGNPISIDGLWALRFGNNGGAGPSGTLFFTAGPNGESGGLFGELVPAPEPSTWLTLAGALAVLTVGRRRR
jgi:uncharacterized protein (TIGR03118 family)